MMKKALLLFFWLFVLFFSSCYFVWVFFPQILSKMIETELQVPVSIKEIRIHSDHFTVDTLIVKSPKGSQIPTALQIKTIRVTTPYLNYFKDPIIIDKMILDQIYLGIEFYTKDQSKGNWNTILQDTKKDHHSIFSVERNVTIKYLRMNDISIDFTMPGTKIHTLDPIPYLEYTNVTTQRGIPTHEITEAIVQHMMGSVFIIKGLKAIIEIPKDILEFLFSPMSIFGESKKPAEPAHQS